jgi:hypothetical protein
MQRGRIKWATIVDENTKFFHSTATIKYNKNNIMILKDKDGHEKFEHEDKATLLWEAFKERLGTSEYTTMHFDLNYFLQPSNGLDILATPFSPEEINTIVQHLPNGKSTGPDGFNNEFIKKCWEVISQDFYDIFHDFYNHNICIQSINGSHIMLVPKMENPSRVGDFRPISLLNSSIKLITMAMANRLQYVILKLVYQN